MVRNYTDLEILEKVSKIGKVPNEWHLVGIRSKVDESNKFDDKFYLFLGEKFVLVTTGTTNAGLKYLTSPINPLGCAVVKSNEQYKDLWVHGLHKGRIDALVQNTPVKFFRDNNRDGFCDEKGKIYEEMIGLNFHPNTYGVKNSPSKEIGGWSAGCQVCNVINSYYQILNLTKNQKKVTYTLLLEE